MLSSSVCPHCRSSAELSAGQCPACGASFAPLPLGIVSGEAREFGVEPSDIGIRLDDGSTACPVAFGHYQVHGLIGKGGMGLVYHAVHTRTREEVAIKTVRVRKRGMLHRIRREINALARIEHPGLVRVIETGQSEGLPWYAMELLQGQSLHDRLLEARVLPPSPVNPEPPRSSGWDTRAAFVLGSGSSDEAFLIGPVDETTATAGVEVELHPSEIETDDGALPDPPTRVVSTSSPTETRASDPDAETTDGWVASRPIERPPPELIPEGDLRDFLVLMAKLCETLAYLHGEGIVHRDIKPQNVIIRPDGTPVLLDFGLASYFGAGGRESLEVGGKVEGTPEYMSPEQIRGEYVDARADLYAVGCILYEGVTGQVPFRGKTPGGTLRAHLKVKPASPRSIRADVPEELDALILHLLAKKSGDRLGYARDIIAVFDRLGCVERGWGGERPSRDYLYRPGFVGRDLTLATFEKQVRRSLARPGRIVFLRGQSGVGKTRFIMELARQLEQGGLTVATGECLPIVAHGARDGGPAIRATPLHPFRPFLQMVVDCCLERGCEEVARLLGPGGGVLSICEPSLSDLPGAPDGQADVAEEGEEGSLPSRLIEALGETLTEFGRTSPVVVFLDDLDCADALTLHFLALFHVGVWDAPNVAIVAAYRSEGGDAAIRDYLPVFRDATFVDIGPLEHMSLREIVRDMLGSNVVDDRFVGHLARRSGGNPFFVAEFLRAAVTEGVLRRDRSGCWRAGTGTDGADLSLDAETFDSTIGMPDLLHDLVVRRLSGLSDDARRLLELAAVVGREVDAELLESVDPIGESRAMAAVETLLVAQVLEEGRDGNFRFAHDKLREVAYEQIPADRRRGLHRSVALVIEDGLEGLDERSRHSTTLSHHWYRSIGNRATEPDAVAQALGYLEASTRLSVSAGLPAEAVEFGRAAARLLGVELPEAAAEVERESRLEMERIDVLLVSRRLVELLELPHSTDPKVDRTVALLLDILAPAFLSNQLGLFSLMASKILGLTIERGLGPRAASVFAMAALVRGIVLYDSRSALEFADLSIELDRRAGGTQTAEVLFLKGWFVGHWVVPIHEVLPDVDRGAQAGLASGDVLYGCYNHAAYLTLLAAGGEQLLSVIEEANARIARIGRRVIVARFHCILERQLAKALAGLTSGPTSLSDVSFDEARDLSFICRTTNANQVGFYHVARLKLHYYRGEYSQSMQAADEALAVAGSFARQPAEVDLVFFRALTLIALGAPGDLCEARRHLATLQGWRVGCEANFGHKALLVEAELARAECLDKDAGRYVEAARSAEESGFRQHAALARELGARHLGTLGEDPRPMLRAAIDGYRGWGANALADWLEAGG
jgi:predicted ATPase